MSKINLTSSMRNNLLSLQKTSNLLNITQERLSTMLSLQTRQQLAVNALSLASQAQQSVMKLF